MKKISQTDVEMHTKFTVHLDKHPSTMLDQKHISKQALQSSFKTLHTMEDSIFTVDMYAIRTALTKIVEANGENGSYTIFLDTQSTLLGLKSWASVFLVAKQLRISFCSVPGHVGSVGNVKADSAGREAAINKNNPKSDRAIHLNQHEKAN